ncbi:hypothetical protein M8C21_026565, partial [Ambrosia artemisiifolia]
DERGLLEALTEYVACLLYHIDVLSEPHSYSHRDVIVTCHPSEVATYEDEDVNESMKVLCVLHMDSLRGSHTGLQGFVQSYLKEEWKARQHIVSEDIASRFDNLSYRSSKLCLTVLNVGWFPPAEASLKRVVIQKLICDLLENPHQEPNPTTDDDQRCHLSSLTTDAHK